MECTEAETPLHKIRDLERQIDLVNSDKEILNNEGERLRGEINSEEESTMKILTNFEIELDSKFRDQVNLLQLELDDDKTSCEQTKEKLKKRIEDSLETNKKSRRDEQDNLSKKLNHLLDENDMLKQKISDLSEVDEFMVGENKYSCSRIKDLEESVEIKSQVFENLKKANKEAVEARKITWDEIALLKSDISSMEAGSVNYQRQGNSMFAEIEENKYILKKNLTLLKGKYKEVKSRIKIKESENSEMLREKARLRYKIQRMNVKPEMKPMEDLKLRIKHLEDSIEILMKKTDVNITPENVAPSLKWVFSSLEEASRERRELQLELKTVKQQQILDCEHLIDFEREVSKLKAELADFPSIVNNSKINKK